MKRFIVCLLTAILVLISFGPAVLAQGAGEDALADLRKEMKNIKKANSDLMKKVDQITVMLERAEEERAQLIARYEQEKEEALKRNTIFLEEYDRRQKQSWEAYDQHKRKALEFNERLSEERESSLREYQRLVREARRYNEEVLAQLKDAKDNNFTRDGVQVRFYPDGSVHNEIPYENGTINGVLKAYYEGGALRAEAEYINGQLSGEFKYYRQNGTLRHISRYVDNDFVDAQLYAQDGNVITARDFGKWSFHSANVFSDSPALDPVSP